LATLSGAFNPTGNIIFTLYAQDGVTVLHTDTQPVHGNGLYYDSIDVLDLTGDFSPNGGPYPVLWKPHWDGNAFNNPAAGASGIQNIVRQGVTPLGSALYIDGATNNVDVQIVPLTTGIQVIFNGSSSTFTQAFSNIRFFTFGGNFNVGVASTLGTEIDATLVGRGNGALNCPGKDPLDVDPGNGNVNVRAGDGTNVVTLGDGNDSVQLGNGNNSVTLGNGNDNVQVGDGNNTVTLGNGNDNVQVGNGNSVVVTGNGHNTITAGNGNNLIAAGLGQHTVQAGNGSNILIDGSVQLTSSSDSLGQVLADWASKGASAANVSSIRSRLAVTYNSSYHNTLLAGSGLDWFFETYAGDVTNRKATDLLN
jgi:Ca2+-binding RTX toxin-like protein